MAFVNQDLYPGEFLLHKKYAKSELLLSLVWTHSNIVAEIAIDRLDNGEFEKSNIKREFVIQASLLHDIGVYACGGFEWMPGQEPVDRPYVQHTVVGAWILQQEGYDPSIVQVTHNHAGVGINTLDITNYGLQLPAQDFVPRSTFEQLISFSAKFHSKAPKFKDVSEIELGLKSYGQEKVDVFHEWLSAFGEPNLEPLKEKYADWHKSFKYQMENLHTPGAAPLNSAGIATSL